MTLSFSMLQPDYEQLFQSLQVEANKSSAMNILPPATIQFILELVAGVGTLNGFQAIRAAQEAILDTAQLPSARLAISRMLGVHILRKQPARCNVILNRSANDISQPFDIPAFTQFTCMGVPLFNRTTISFDSMDTVGQTSNVILQGSQQVITRSSTIPLFQGSIISNVKNPFASNGQPFQRFILGSPDFSISDTDIYCLVDGITPYYRITDGLWGYPIDTTDINAIAPQVFLDSTLPNGQVEILFGNGTYGAIPPLTVQSAQGIVFTFAVTKGAQGNIYNSANQSVSCGYSDKNSTVTGATITAIGGGADERDSTFYQNMSPGMRSAFKRMVTRPDHRAIALTYPQVIDCAFLGQADIDPTDVRWMNAVQATILTDPPMAQYIASTKANMSPAWAIDISVTPTSIGDTTSITYYADLLEMGLKISSSPITIPLFTYPFIPLTIIANSSGGTDGTTFLLQGLSNLADNFSIDSFPITTPSTANVSFTNIDTLNYNSIISGSLLDSTSTNIIPNIEAPFTVSIFSKAYLSTNHYTSSPGTKLAGDFTIECSFFVYADETIRDIFDSRLQSSLDLSDSVKGINLGLRENNRPFLRVGSDFVIVGASTALANPTNTTLVNGVWNYLVCTRKANKIYLFLNGYFQGMIINNTNFSDGNCIIGSNLHATEAFHGAIANFRITQQVVYPTWIPDLATTFSRAGIDPSIMYQIGYPAGSTSYTNNSLALLGVSVSPGDYVIYTPDKVWIKGDLTYPGSPQWWSYFLTWVGSRCISTTQFVRQDPVPIYIDVELDIFVFNNIDLNSANTAVRNIITKYFKLQLGSLGRDILVSDLYEHVLNDHPIPTVDYADIKKPAANIILSTQATSIYTELSNTVNPNLDSTTSQIYSKFASAFALSGMTVAGTNNSKVYYPLLGNLKINTFYTTRVSTITNRNSLMNSLNPNWQT